MPEVINICSHTCGDDETTEIDYHIRECLGLTVPMSTFADGLMCTFDGYTDLTELHDH